jgi:hypothetical protein
LTAEGLEPRNLLSAFPAGRLAVAQAASPSPSDLGPPTPNELARQRFVARLAGTFQTAPGRFLHQPVQGLILSSGGSNQSLHLQSQMQFFLYDLPGTPPTGQIALAAKNISTTGSLLLLDLTSDGVSFAHGLPTRFTWTVNDGSGGAWQGATGQGTLDVSYRIFRRPRGVRIAGAATVSIQGTVQTNHNLTNPIFLPGNRPQNPGG